MSAMAGRRAYLPYTLLAFGYAFLYAPIASLVVYSFNGSRLVTVWGGFSTRWYGELMGNEALLAAAWLSLRIGAATATLATLLGTAAALALTRFGRVRGRLMLSALVAAPLVMPDVITGLAALLLFVGLEDLIGWPAGRGMSTIVIAHVTFAVAYVTVLVRSRLIQVDPAIEEAALDLGARPWRVVATVTLPAIAPALAAGWLLAFTLSLDDLVVASFVSGPGASTLPMVVYSSVRLGVSPQINALATLVLTAVAVAVGLAGWLLAREARKQQ